MWKKGTGEEEPTTGVPPGRYATAPSTFQGVFVLGNMAIPGSVEGEHLDV